MNNIMLLPLGAFFSETSLAGQSVISYPVFVHELSHELHLTNLQRLIQKRPLLKLVLA